MTFFRTGWLGGAEEEKKCKEKVEGNDRVKRTVGALLKRKKKRRRGGRIWQKKGFGKHGANGVGDSGRVVKKGECRRSCQRECGTQEKTEDSENVDEWSVGLRNK